MNNITVENAQDRTAVYREAVIMNTGSENCTVTNSNILIYGSLAEDKGQIEKQLTLN